MKIFKVKFEYWNEGFEEKGEYGNHYLSVAASTLEEAIDKVKSYVFENYGYDEEFKYDEETGRDVELDEPIHRAVTKVEIKEAQIVAESDIS